MKKSIFVIIIFFIIGLPFSSQAVQPISQKKSKHQPINFSKKQKKLNFFQRIILKKIQRKIARQARKKKKEQEGFLNDKQTRQSIFFGLGSALAAQGALIAASISKFVARIRYLVIFGGIAVMLGVIAIIFGIKSLRKRKIIPNEKRSRWKAWFGIFLGIIGFLLTLQAVNASY